MARKFGKKNVIKIDPLAYNLGIIGLSGVGKSTLAKEVCEKLVGEDGYLLLSIGKEDAYDAIADVVAEQIPDWAKLNDVFDNIIENRTTDWKDLKVVVWDTLDELFKIAEKEVIRLHNRKSPDKKVTTINSAFGGFGRGEDTVIEIILDKIWELKKLGISMFVIGHTKSRTMTDVVTGQEYDMLTTNMTHKYFNAIKTKLHILGVASIKRDISKIKTGKDIMGKDKYKNIINEESRIITFRDDNYNIDSKSRFAEIIDEIPLNSDEFIKAVKDAIVLEHNKQKNKKDIKTTEKEQLQQKEVEVEENVKKLKEKQKVETAQEQLEILKNDVEKLKTTPTKLKPLVTQLKELGYSSIDDVLNLEHIEILRNLI